MFFSKMTCGFYDPAIHGDNIPTDAVEITAERHAALLVAQSSGQRIESDENGYPIATDQLLPLRTHTSLLSDAAEKRWQVETGGIIVAGVPIKTDRVAQAQLNSAYISLKSGLIADTPWKAADGSFTLVTLAELEPVAKAVAEHVSSCFAAELAHTEAINLLQTQAELDTYDIHAAWPTSQ